VETHQTTHQNEKEVTMAQQFQVRIQITALEYLAISAIESFCEGRGKKNNKNNYVETLGYLWGVSKTVSDCTVISVERAITSISAQRRPGSVTPNDKAFELMNGVVRSWSPHLTCLGDFHTHPYESSNDVKTNKGWQYSTRDEEALVEADNLWQHFSNPLMLVLAICPMQRVHTKVFDQPQWNCVTFGIGEFSFWLSAAVGIEDGGTRKVTGNTRSKVELKVPSGEWVLPGAKLIADRNK
jgi:hypothetical protein